jgi:hypothetical protein
MLFGGLQGIIGLVLFILFAVLPAAGLFGDSDDDDGQARPSVVGTPVRLPFADSASGSAFGANCDYDLLVRADFNLVTLLSRRICTGGAYSGPHEAFIATVHYSQVTNSSDLRCRGEYLTGYASCFVPYVPVGSNTVEIPVSAALPDGPGRAVLIALR